MLLQVLEVQQLQRNLTSALVSTYIAYLVASDSVTIARDNEAIAKDILQTVERRIHQLCCPTLSVSLDIASAMISAG